MNKKLYIIFIVLGLMVLVVPVRCDWGMYQGDASHDGVAYFQPIDNPTLLWNESSNTVFSSPIISQGVVYVGANNSRMYALNESNGLIIWSFLTSNSILTTPCVGLTHIFFGTSDNKIYSLFKDNGTIAWMDNFDSSSAFIGSLIINTITQIIYVGSTNGYLYALNATNGSTIWSFADGQINVSPVENYGLIYFGVKPNRPM